MQPNALEKMDRLMTRTGRLHSSASVTQKILSLMRNPDFDMTEVVACLERDPALAAKILRVVNSTHYGLAHRVSCLRHAATILGQRSLRMFAVTFALVDTFISGPLESLYVDY